MRKPMIIATSMLLAGGAFAQPQPKSFLANPEDLSPEARALQERKLDGPFILKTHRRAKDLLIGDFNADGLPDIAVTSNERSLLELQISRKPEGGEPYAFDKREVSLDRIIRSAVAMDANGDGRLDILLAGSPPRLLVMYQDAEGKLQAATQTEVEAERLVVGDINGDGKDDLLVYSQRRFQIFYHENDALNLTPAETFYTLNDPGAEILLIDANGDGRTDIVYQDSQRNDSVIVRLQNEDGTFPSEYRITTGALRQLTSIQTAKGSRALLAGILNSTRQLIVLRLSDTTAAEAETSTVPLSAPHVIPFAPELRSRRATPLITDYNGNGRKDVVLISPDLSNLRLLEHTENGALREQVIPSLQGVETVIPIQKVADSDAPSLLFFSPEEKAIGFSTYDPKSESLPFPRLLPVSGAPTGATVFPNGDDYLLVAVIENKLIGFDLTREGRLSNQRRLTAGGDMEASADFATSDKVLGLEPIDVNRDGRMDLAVFIDFKPAQIYTQSEGGQFAALAATSGVLEGLLAATRPGSIFGIDISDNGSEPLVLAVKEKFARAFQIDEEGNVVVEQQFNGRNSSSRLVDATTGKLRKDMPADVILLDRANRCLTIYGRREAGRAFELLTNVALDEGNYTSVRTLDLDGDGRDDIVLNAEDRVAVLYSKPGYTTLESVATASSSIEEGAFGRVYAGNLLGSEMPQLVTLEMKQNMMEFYELGTSDDDATALHRFYQFRTFSVDSSIAMRTSIDDFPEPRELVITDINGDGMAEVVCLMHDNIIIYYPTLEDGTPAH